MRTIALFLIGIVCIAATSWLIWHFVLTSRNSSLADVGHESPAMVHLDVGHDAFSDESEVEANLDRGAMLAEIAKMEPVLPASVEDVPLEESDNAAELLLLAAERFGWPEESALQAARNWKATCEKAREIGLFRGVPKTDLLELFGESYVSLIPFAEFCRGLYDPDAGTLSQDLVENLRSRSATQVSPYLDWRDMAELVETKKDFAQQELVSHLHHALLNFDEAQVFHALSFLIGPQLGAIAPNVSERPVPLSEQYVLVLPSLTLALMCHYHGGCPGLGHPLVLRTCVEAYRARGIGCIQPNDIFEAIYQTMTPVEHMHFLHLFEEINGMLRVYRNL